MRGLLLAAVALAAAAAVTASSFAHPGVAGPDPKRMTLTPNDVGYVARVEKEGYTTPARSPRRADTSATFSGLSPGTVQFLTSRRRS